MTCCPHCEGADTFFDTGAAQGDLDAYRSAGPSTTTAWLLDALKARGVAHMSLLDIGGGVGVIQHELIAAGAARTVDIDASRAYLETARAEAEQRGYGDRAEYHFGDFVDMAAQIDPADIVTLDRVLCCYPDVAALVTLSARRARRYYGLIYPLDRWYLRWTMPLLNLLLHRLRGSRFRNFIHPTEQVNALVRAEGLEPIFERHNLIWQVVVFARSQ